MKVKDEEKDSTIVDTLVPAPSREFLDELVPSTKRPKHRTGFLGLFGPKVDTVDWCSVRIQILSPILCFIAMNRRRSDA